MGFCAPCADYKNKQLFTNMKIKQTALICNKKHLQATDPMGLCAPWDDTYLHNCILEELAEPT